MIVNEVHADLLIVTKAISQLKWVWFRTEKKLADLETFDRASRGPWGAIKLSFTLRGL